MSRYYYDFHIHSCLSPCGDDDMTPNNICGMATLNGLNLIALTDHNSVKNCPAFFSCAKKYGIVPVAGMELTTAEDIHVICLFEYLDDALSFGRYVDSQRVLIKNKTEIFGHQYILDENDEIIGEEEHLLSNATAITVDDVKSVAEQYGGVCYPAHVDRQSNGIIATLGLFPDKPDFRFAEFNDCENIPDYTEKYPNLKDKKILVSSDAHYLWKMKDAKEYIELEDENYSSENVRKELFKYLRGEKT